MTWDELQERLVASMEQPLGYQLTRALAATALADEHGLIQLAPRGWRTTPTHEIVIVGFPGPGDPATVIAAVAALWRLLNPLP